MLIQAGMARQKIYDIDEIKRSSAVAERARDAATVTAPAWHVWDTLDSIPSITKEKLHDDVIKTFYGF